MASAMPSTMTAHEGDARKPRVLEEFVVVDLPSDHPARRQQHEAPVPPGVEDDDQEEAPAAKGKGQKAPSAPLAAPRGLLDQAPPLPVRLPEAAIERASAGLRPGDAAGAQVLREVFGDALPWTEQELFCSK